MIDKYINHAGTVKEGMTITELTMNGDCEIAVISSIDKSPLRMRNVLVIHRPYNHSSQQHPSHYRLGKSISFTNPKHVAGPEFHEPA